MSQFNKNYVKLNIKIIFTGSTRNSTSQYHQQTRELLIEELQQLVEQAQQKLDNLRDNKHSQIEQQTKVRLKVENKLIQREQKVKILKKEISNMKKDIDEAFGLQKIITLENTLKDQQNQRIALEHEIQLLLNCVFLYKN